MGTAISSILHVFPQGNLDAPSIRSGSVSLTLPCYLWHVIYRIWGWTRKGTEASTSFDRTLMFETTFDVLRLLQGEEAKIHWEVLGGTSPVGSPRRWDLPAHEPDMWWCHSLPSNHYPTSESSSWGPRHCEADRLFPLVPFQMSGHRIPSIIKWLLFYATQFVVVHYSNQNKEPVCKDGHSLTKLPQKLELFERRSLGRLA